jgi:hypothetical protein
VVERLIFKHESGGIQMSIPPKKKKKPNKKNLPALLTYPSDIMV